MEKLTVYYSVRSGGDGSAYPTFMESKELCEWDQDHMDEGWGESCDGSISFESESPIICTDSIVTKESYLIEEYIEGWEPDEDEKKEYISTFFPDGLPKFSIKIENYEDTDPIETTKYCYNLIFIGDKQVARMFKEQDISGDVFENVLNSIKND